MSKVQFKTPIGEFNWVFINGQGKESLNGDMKYSIDVKVPADEAEEAIKILNDLWEDNKPKGMDKPKSMGFKADEDGNVTFTLKTGTTFPSGDKKTIAVYNAQAEKINFPEDKKIGNGSQGRASGVASIYTLNKKEGGVTLYLDAIQLTKFVEYQGGASFDEVEGGFKGFEELPFEIADLTD